MFFQKKGQVQRCCRTCPSLTAPHDVRLMHLTIIGGGVTIGGTSTCGEEVLPPSGPPGRGDRGNALPGPVACGSGIFPRVIGSADAMDPERIYRIVRPFVLNGCPRLMGVGARPDGSLVGPWTILLERSRSGVEGLDAGRWFSYAVSCGVTSVVPCLLCDGDEPDAGEAVHLLDAARTATGDACLDIGIEFCLVCRPSGFEVVK